MQDNVGEDLSEHRVSADGEHTENQKDAKSHRGYGIPSRGDQEGNQQSVNLPDCSLVMRFARRVPAAAVRAPAEAVQPLCRGARSAVCAVPLQYRGKVACLVACFDDFAVIQR